VSAKSLSLLTLVIFSWISVPAQAAEARFVDAETYFSTSKLGRSLLPQGFSAVEEKLVEQFDVVCPDTFCEGEVSNWRALSLRCAIDQKDHVVGECVWNFAGTLEEVDAETGQLYVSHENRRCTLGVQADAAELADFLRRASEAEGYARGLLTVVVPGRADGRTLYEVIANCL
jgi:hypothetical protein